tara:strand:- start:14029 stop:14433 length:405 start_codon:yes stop_codon:yes gene_type:complete
MGISKKSAPIVDDTDLNRAFADIYDDINEIIDSVNSSLIALGDLSAGKPGDLRISKVGEDKYRVEARSAEGWIRPGGTDTPITSLTDDTTGTISDTLNDTTSDTKDDLASLASKVNEIITQLNNITFRLVKKNE